MDIMEGNLQGWWRPSPGSIYPLLEGLVKEGALSRSEDKKYSLTAKGLEEIEHPFPWTDRESLSPRSPDDVIELMSSYVSYLEDLARSDGKTISPRAGQIRDLAARLEKLGSAN